MTIEVTGCQSKTVGKIITEAMNIHELVPERVENVLGFTKGHIRKIMNDEIYTNSVPIILFKNLLLSLHIRFCDIEQAFIPTYKLMKSKENDEYLKKKPSHYMLWENEEALFKYTSRLKYLMTLPSNRNEAERNTISEENARAFADGLSTGIKRAKEFGVWYAAREYRNGILRQVEMKTLDELFEIFLNERNEK